MRNFKKWLRSDVRRNHEYNEDNKWRKESSNRSKRSGSENSTSSNSTSSGSSRASKSEEELTEAQ